MADFVNDYVVEAESGHPGMRSYNLIATPESWRILAAQITEALAKEELAEEGRANLGTINKRGEVLLVSKYATQSGGQTERVYLNIMAAKDLSFHHASRGLVKTITGYAGCLAVLCTLALALFGFCTLLYRLMGLS